MNINFHYHTIKAAAIIAGFSEEDAQTIASYSQFVDDYSRFKRILLKKVPPFAKHLTTITEDGVLQFNPVTTGFENLFETALLILEPNQKNILIPFHFIPPQPLTQKVKSRKEWRVKPTKIEDKSEPSLIRDLLLDAKEKYQKNRNDTANLIRIGLLLHIFSDTYAHQGFSGFENWENYAKLKNVKDNRTGKDITKKYKPKFFSMTPSLGHANIGHTADDTHISFTMKQKTGKYHLRYTETYSRNNTEEFLYTIYEIINYLRSCLEKEPLWGEEWKLLSIKFREGLLAPYTNTKQKDLNTYWKVLFPNTQFYYNAETLCIFNDAFFMYNVIADDIRKHVNWGENSMGQISKPVKT